MLRGAFPIFQGRGRLMKLSAKTLVLVPFLLLAVGFATAPAEAGALAYPSTDHASFLVDLPDDWEITPGEGVGDYVHVNSPGGVYLAFRTLPASESAMNDAIEDSVSYVEGNYKGAALSEPAKTAQKGLDAFFIDGSGKEEDGTPVTFRMVFVALKDGSIGEIWFAAPLSDKAGIAAAAKVLNSFRAP